MLNQIHEEIDCNLHNLFDTYGVEVVVGSLMRWLDVRKSKYAAQLNLDLEYAINRYKERYEKE